MGIATRLLFVASATAALLAIPAETSAMPPGPGVFCDTYPGSPLCMQDAVDCGTCHDTPPARNAFGRDIETYLLPGTTRPLDSVQYSDGLPQALHDVEDLDSDGDGFTNFDEILSGTNPADADSTPGELDCSDGSPNEHYNVCGYDAPYAYRKVALDFCGLSPTMNEMDTFRGLDATAQVAEIEVKLRQCLTTPFWRGRDGEVWKLAHAKINPLQALKGGPENPGIVPIGDWLHDYSLFVWTQIDDHDARDVLIGDYFVAEDGGGAYHIMSAAEEAAITGADARENVEPQYRAGMLTTKWFLLNFTMFAVLPRAAAAQAYRAYLGLDWAKMEGLTPVPGEPSDFDNKGVDAPTCAGCHSTIDPNAYAFQNYQGFGPGGRANFIDNRMALFEGAFPGISTMPSGYLFGQQVPDLVTWAATAADSDDFARATVGDYWKLLMGDAPRPEFQGEFNDLWSRFKSDHNYSVDKMLVDFVKTEAYGVP